MKSAFTIIISWLPLAVAITGVSVIIYAAVQQNYRQSLNDPQIQMAEDAAAALEAGTPVAQVISVGDVETVDIAKSLAPWIALYGASGMPLLSTGELTSAMPQLPRGVFDTSAWSTPIIGHHLNSQPTDEDRFSWQPSADVRQAVVLVQVTGRDDVAYVAAGRNMREVEDRESMLGTIVFLGWLVTMLGSFLFKAAAYYFSAKMEVHGRS